MSERNGGRRVYGLRFRAYGERQYVTLGSDKDGWTQETAENRCKDQLAKVRLGIWQPPKPPQSEPEPDKEPTFHKFSSDWFLANQGAWRPKTRVDYQWQLSSH